MHIRMSLRVFIGGIGAILMVGGMAFLGIPFGAGTDPTDGKTVGCGSVLNWADPNREAQTADDNLARRGSGEHFARDCRDKFSSHRNIGAGVIAIGGIAVLGAVFVQVPQKEDDAEEEFAS